MRSRHSPGHWIAVALVLAFALLTLSNLYGQRSDGSSVYRGRPAMAGAQSGTGAQAGLPQGGLGQQGTEGAERALLTWPGREQNALPSENPREDNVEPPPNITGPRDAPPRKQDDSMRDKDKSMTPKKDSGVAKDETSASKKVKRAAKGTADRARHGVSPIGSTAPTAPTASAAD